MRGCRDVAVESLRCVGALAAAPRDAPSCADACPWSIRGRPRYLDERGEAAWSTR